MRFLCCIFILLSFFARGQTLFPPLIDRVATDSQTLNVVAINTVAQALEAKNIQVLVVVLEMPTVSSDETAWQYFEEAIAHYGFVVNAQYLPNFFAIFIQLPPDRRDYRQGGVWFRYGQQFVKTLEYSTTNTYLVEEFGHELSTAMIAAVKSKGDYADVINKGLLRFADITTVCAKEPVGQCGYSFSE